MCCLGGDWNVEDQGKNSFGSNSQSLGQWVRMERCLGRQVSTKLFLKRRFLNPLLSKKNVLLTQFDCVTQMLINYYLSCNVRNWKLCGGPSCTNSWTRERKRRLCNIIVCVQNIVCKYFCENQNILEFYFCQKGYLRIVAKVNQLCSSETGFINRIHQTSLWCSWKGRRFTGDVDYY